jgi:NADPH-dependent FMN reductase
MAIRVRKGQAPPALERAEFGVRFRNAFVDPAFRAEDDAIARLEEIAWDAYREERKSPLTRKAGRGYADPAYDLSLDWLETRARLRRAQAAWAEATTKTRVLVVCGSPRNDGTCPGETSKTFRLAGIVSEALEAAKVAVDFLDLSRPLPNTGARSIRARAACRRPCRSAIGPAAAIRTIRSARPTTGWPRSTSAGSPLTASSSSRRCTGTRVRAP